MQKVWVMDIAAELLKLVERVVLDPKKEGKPWLREGNFDWYIFFKSIHTLLDTVHGDQKKKKKGHSFFGQSYTGYTFLGIKYSA